MTIMVATPAYGGQFYSEYVMSLLALQRQCAKGELLFLFPRDSHIDRARNTCVEMFLQTPCTHLFFIDADVGFKPSSFLRIAGAGKDVVGGIYPLKTDEDVQDGFPVLLKDIGKPDAEGFAESPYAPTGFMCIARSVLEKIGGPGWFDSLRVEGEGFLTEDFAFCHRWKWMGGKIHVDTRCDLTHTGDKVWDRPFSRAVAASRAAPVSPAFDVVS